MSSEETEERKETNDEENDEKTEEKKEEKGAGCFEMNKVYLVSKGFFFFFFAAQGSLLPYLALFFKQLELPANQIGAITGMKPYIAFFFIPFWGCVADRFKKGKLLFVISMIAIVLGMVAYALVPINICDAEVTSVSSRTILNNSKHRSHLKENAVVTEDEPLKSAHKPPMEFMEMEKLGYRNVLGKRPYHITGLISKISPIKKNTDFTGLRLSIRNGRTAKFGPGNLTSMDEVSEMADESLEETPWSQSDMIALQDNKRKTTTRKNSFIFLYLLFATIFSTILSCPSLTLADTATVNLLKRNGETHKYGKQRLWGSIGYGSMAFLIGAAVSRTHLCPPGSARRRDVNYYPCFVMYVIYNLIALVIGIRFDFNNNNKTKNGHDDEGATSIDDKLPQSQRMEETKTSGKGVIAGLKLLTQPKHAMFLVTAFYVGITMGFIRVFLFWHLKDLGGTQILFSIMTAINCVSEVTLYFLSTKLISFIGTIRVLYLGLICYSIRLFYYAFVSNPWTVLPIELLSGITTAAVWAAMMSYVGTHSVEGASVTLQGKQDLLMARSFGTIPEQEYSE